MPLVFSLFQSTLPVRGATHGVELLDVSFFISIHAPRTGSDPRPDSGRPCPPDFNPRSPYGERRLLTQILPIFLAFQSTLPVRGATCPVRHDGQRPGISIHAPRTGSDFAPQNDGGTWVISIHAPRTGSDSNRRRTPSAWAISIHAPRTGSDRACPRIHLQ